VNITIKVLIDEINQAEVVLPNIEQNNIQGITEEAKYQLTLILEEFFLHGVIK